MNDRANRECIIVGAFDRHNFGDLLFSHIAPAALGGAKPVFAAAASRDLRPFSGPLTRSLAGLAPGAADIIHAGGEILSCTAWQAAAMLLPPGEASAAIRYLEADDARRDSFIRETLGRDAAAPYVAGRDLFPQARAIVFCGVGGIGLEDDDAMRREVCAQLRDADFIGVRDRRTLALLQREGVPARLMPDPAVLLRELCGPRVVRHGRAGECAALRQAFSDGYLAVQCSADFGDDATLDMLAQQLDLLARDTGLGAVLFRAGAATWHDDPEVHARLAARLRQCRARIFQSLDAFDICALIAGSAGYCGSSLHGRIVAMAYGLPRANLCPPPCDAAGKTAAFAAAWDAGLPGAVLPAQLAAAMSDALALPPAVLREAGATAAAECRRAFDAIRTLLA
ncbi:polysaccharide pyruvyl transferase family protein [Noviherbaspirillum aridicola]|uniref:Polysaccharide pyruvyl transferase domain-containing protein n=1 Tax=Noviherbaspirillum aridicola TaxID=2849687 RepID=A0ABQ4Q133_9BURK|nr:polysaccharide pyruvyl transferase family protein [Noviherbaspirillum aridicola]GIZ50500.1 hypothetical protein NCCP691_05140 [Noviherbaspirillum aridicola]